MPGTVARERIALLVNGEAVELLLPVHKTLLEVLREDLDLTGTKHGCELGECGACAVLIDGEPILLPHAADRSPGARRDRDRRGTWPGHHLHPLQSAFAEWARPSAAIARRASW